MELSSIRPAGWFNAISSIFLQIRPQFYFCLHCWLPITSIFEGIEKSFSYQKLTEIGKKLLCLLAVFLMILAHILTELNQWREFWEKVGYIMHWQSEFLSIDTIRWLFIHQFCKTDLWEAQVLKKICFQRWKYRGKLKMSGISKIGIFSEIVHWHVTQNGALNYGMLLKTFFYVIHSYIPIN